MRLDAKTLAIVAALVAFALTLVLWPKKARSAEDEIRALVAQCVASVEDKSLSTISDAMADDFKGPDNASRAEVKQLIAYQVLRSGEATTLFNPSLTVTVTNATGATISGKFIFARGKPKSLDGLPQGEALGAYQIDARLEKRDGRWKFLAATYRPL